MSILQCLKKQRPNFYFTAFQEEDEMNNKYAASPSPYSAGYFHQTSAHLRVRIIKECANFLYENVEEKFVLYSGNTDKMAAVSLQILRIFLKTFYLPFYT